MDSHMQPISKILIHKEKKQKKNNKTTGQIDNLKKYSNATNMSTDNMSTDDKQIQREARYIKNIHIDKSLEQLKSVGLVNGNQYDAWWCKVFHTLGVAFVTAQADRAMTYGKQPQALFHFLINKEMNRAIDDTLPRFN